MEGAFVYGRGVGAKWSVRSLPIAILILWLYDVMLTEESHNGALTEPNNVLSSKVAQYLIPLHEHNYL